MSGPGSGQGCRSWEGAEGVKTVKGGNPTRGGEGEVFPCRGLGLGGGVGPGKEPGVTSG